MACDPRRLRRRFRSRIAGAGEAGEVDWLTNEALPVLARIFLVWIFPFSFIDKIVNWKNALGQATSSWLPGGPVLLVLAMLVELCTPPMIVLGFYDGIAAFVLAGYCAVTGVVYHAFWSYPRFWSPQSAGYPHIWDFFKNFALVGGLIYVMYDAGFIQAVGSDVEQVSKLTGLN
jgi:putative oxidoreductase